MKSYFIPKKIAFYFVILPFFLQHATASELRFEVRVSPVSNLVYQLDCMAKIIRCSSSVYEELWNKKLKWVAADQNFLTTWKEVRSKYQGEIRLNKQPIKPFDLPWSGPTGIQLGDKFSITTYHAKDKQDLKMRLESLASPSDIEKIDAILSHFEPRFVKWWKSSAQASLSDFKKALNRKVNQLEIQKKLNEFAKFYEAEYPKNYLIYINLFYRPVSKTKGTFATVYENHAAVEVIPGEKVANILDVVIHEICHFFHSSASEEKKRQLLSKFANSSDPIALATHNILNEALATAFGNGIAAELWMDSKHYKTRANKASGFYNDIAIDAAAKSLIPMLKEDIQEGKTLYSPKFTERAILNLENGMPMLIQEPARLLTELAAIYEPEFAEAVHSGIRSKLRGGFYAREGFGKDSSWETLKTYPKLNTIFFISPDSLKQLKNRGQWVPEKDLAALKEHHKKNKSFVYAIERYPSTYTFLVAAKTSLGIEKEFNRLLGAKQRFNGVLR